VRIWTVARGQLVAYGTATQMREAHQHWLDEQARTANALEVPDGTQV
jgi:hypothetical protein